MDNIAPARASSRPADRDLAAEDSGRRARGRDEDLRARRVAAIYHRANGIGDIVLMAAFNTGTMAAAELVLARLGGATLYH
jgi:hypothetical protein